MHHEILLRTWPYRRAVRMREFRANLLENSIRVLKMAFHCAVQNLSAVVPLDGFEPAADQLTGNLI